MKYEYTEPTMIATKKIWLALRFKYDAFSSYLDNTLSNSRHPAAVKGTKKLNPSQNIFIRL